MLDDLHDLGAHADLVKIALTGSRTADSSAG
jgi:hypothetical protein